MDEEIVITAKSQGLDRIVLQMAVEGKSQSKRCIFTGAIRVILAKEQLRKLRGTELKADSK